MSHVSFLFCSVLTAVLDDRRLLAIQHPALHWLWTCVAPLQRNGSCLFLLTKLPCRSYVLCLPSTNLPTPLQRRYSVICVCVYPRRNAEVDIYEIWDQTAVKVSLFNMRNFSYPPSMIPSEAWNIRSKIPFWSLDTCLMPLWNNKHSQISWISTDKTRKAHKRTIF